MKKQNIMVWIIVVLLMYSCKPAPIEDQIKDKFLVFGNTEFLEPNTLKEVAHIEPVDSITSHLVWESYAELKEVAEYIPETVEEGEDRKSVG